MLFSTYSLISQNYFILCFVVCLGTLQWAAVRNEKPELSLLGPWGLGRLGGILGALLVVAGFSWFFLRTPGLFRSGLAGGELTTLFAAGGLSALLTARLAGALWQNWLVYKTGKTRRSEVSETWEL
jgi:hypothetical protein